MAKQNILLKEEEFHDEWASNIDISKICITPSFEACTAPENRAIIKKLGSLKGLKILELGCGAGESSIYFAKQGAQVVATDISQGMLDVVQSLAKAHHVIVETKQAYSHKIDFEENTFDIVYAANLLHHVDLELTLKEVVRVLKPGGKFASWDPLDHNPFINVYRRMATEVRTEDEHPIKWRELNTFRKHFSHLSITTTWFFTLIIFFKFYFIDRINPNKERYWKKIITDHKKLERLYYFWERIDKFMLKFFPFLRRFCWNIVIIATK